MSEASARADDAARPHAPTIVDLLVRPGTVALDQAPERVVAPLASVPSGTGRFLVPTASRRAAARSLLAYNGLRSRRVRLTRLALSGLARVGALGLAGSDRSLRARAGDAVLLDHLGEVLGTPGLTFATTERPGRGFETPMLQLFTARGACVGFAKLGWDPVTRRMVDTEAETLGLVARVRPSSFRSPQVVWHGPWESLAVVVTEPMPPRARRLPAGQAPPIEPLSEVASLDGPRRRERLAASAYWTSARSTAAAAARGGDASIERALDAIEARSAGAALELGRWHGDWVEWNLARAGTELWAWDWAYSAPEVPFGFDLLQFYFLRYRNLEGAADGDALDRAATDAAPGLRALGLDADERALVIALHRVETSLRWARAAQLRTDPPLRAAGTSAAD